MTDNKDDKSNVVQFLNREGNKFFPPTVRIKSINLYGPAIKHVKWGHASPWLSHTFEAPITGEQACRVIEKYIQNGGVMGKIGEEFVFIPWPCAAIYFEYMDVSAGDPPA